MAAKTKMGSLRNILVPLGVLLIVGIIGYSGYHFYETAWPQSDTAGFSGTSGLPEKSLEIVQPEVNWWESRREIYYNIPARVLVYLPDARQDDISRLISNAWGIFEYIGRVFNPFDPDSEISALNKNIPTEWTPVSDDLYHVLQISKKLWKASDGAFDPTFWPVKQLWQQAEKTQQIPSERLIKKTLQRTGLENVILRSAPGKQIRLTASEIQFDFGGIAKGYAIDRVRRFLTNQGIRDGLVQLGGEIVAFGKNRDRDWRIGVQHPRDMNRVWALLSSRSSIRVSTSGNYRQPLMIQGHAFYHIFSPETGKPVSEKILGVTTASTVSSHSNALLDGAATAIAVLGAAKGKILAEKLGIEALILSQGPDRQIIETMTPGLAGLYKAVE